MNKQDYERYKELDRLDHKSNGRISPGDRAWYEAGYDKLSPQQKGAMHRFWKSRASEDYFADAGGYGWL